MKSVYEHIENTIQILRSSIVPVIDEQWQLIAILIQLKNTEIRYHIVYINSDGLHQEVTGHELHAQIATQILLLQSILKGQTLNWNQLELRLHRDSTSELEYSWSYPW
jgi:hypothetical protein